MFATRPAYFVIRSNHAWMVGSDVPGTTDVMGLYRSLDNGVTWDSCGWIGTSGVQSNSKGLFVGGGWVDGISRSTDDGFHWTACKSPAISPGQIMDMVVTDSMIVAKTFDGTSMQYWISTNLASSWKQIQVPQGNWDARCAWGSTIIIATNTGLFRTLDQGESWKQISADSGVTKLAMRRDIVLMAMRDKQVKVSFDRGASWTPANSGLADTVADDFAIDDGQVFVSLHGEGLYRGGIDGLSAVHSSDRTTESAMIQITPNPVSTHATVSYSLAADADVQVDLIDALGRVVATVLPQTYQSAGMHYLPIEVAQIPAGILACRVRIGTSSVVGKLVVTH
ncbi:MAG: T9SS type A sorting domain-containing protein [Bacteroidetes bacterium]|nr:T9SS type A sorting domain-containing protein [Bacteroidota bacterium]